MKLTTTKFLNLLENIKVAKIVEVKKHENADRLLITKIDAGKDYPSDILDKNGLIQIVTGAPNVKEGDFVPFLAPGNIVPGWVLSEGKEIHLESRPMRGEISHGMILAEDEIGIGTDHEGISIIQNQNSKYKVENVDDSLIGKSLTEILSSDSLNYIENSDNILKITPEIEEKIELITRDLQEEIGTEELPQILAERNLKVYWGTAPTGKPSLGYFVPMIKISDFLKAGCEVKILLANIHAFLDNMKSSWEVLEYRTEYYKLVITEILKSLGTPLDKLTFVEGKSYQLKPEYTMDMYKIATLTTVQSVKGAGAEVVKQVESPVLGGMLYPILQALDEEYLEVDAQLGGVDQRKIFMFAREYLPRLNYKKRIHFMNVLIPGLGKSGKMTSSEPSSKIDFDDSDELIKEKINKAFSLDGEVEGNGLLALLKFIIFRKIESENRTFNVERPEKWGGNIQYSSYQEVEKDFINKSLSSVDLKIAIIPEIINLISPIRSVINNNQDLIKKAYGE